MELLQPTSLCQEIEPRVQWLFGPWNSRWRSPWGTNRRTAQLTVSEDKEGNPCHYTLESEIEGVPSHRGIPSHHPFLGGIFPNKNHPALGDPPWRAGNHQLPLFTETAKDLLLPRDDIYRLRTVKAGSSGWKMPQHLEATKKWQILYRVIHVFTVASLAIIVKPC